MLHDFQVEYKAKLTTPDEAVKVVKSGDWVDYTSCLGKPVLLDLPFFCICTGAEFFKAFVHITQAPHTQGFSFSITTLFNTYSLICSVLKNGMTDVSISTFPILYSFLSLN